MDIVGVPEVSAEAELIAAIVSFLESVGLSSQQIAIKVSSRKVLQAVLEQYQVPAESFGPVCVIVDKLDKMPAEKARILQTKLLTSALLMSHFTCLESHFKAIWETRS